MIPGSETRGRRLPIAPVLFTLAVCATHVHAQFREPVPILTDGAVNTGGFVLGTDPFDNIHVAVDESGVVRLHSYLPGDQTQSTVIAENAGEPDLAFYAVGLVLAYSHDDNAGEDAAEDRDEDAIDDVPGLGAAAASRRRLICVSSKIGPTLNDPIVVSVAPAVCRHPRVALDARGRAVVAWESDNEDGEPQILLDGPGFGRVSLGPGTRPNIGVDRNDRVHVVFLRGGAIHYTTDQGRLEGGDFALAEAIASGVATSHGPPQIGLLEGRIVYLAFESAGSIYVSDNRDGSFSAPRVLDRGGATSLDIDVTPGGLVALAWVKGGDVYHLVGNGFFVPDPSVVVTSDEIESDPQISVDRFANAHVVFRRGDNGIFMTTNAGSPHARLTAEPTRGEAPLSVQFTDESRGDINGWQWEFGDGTTSTAQHPSHLYNTSGEYLVKLRVSGPGGTSRLEARTTVVVTDSSNELWIADVRAFVGQENVYVPVMATHDRPAQGFQVAATFDPNVIEIREIEFTYTNLRGLSPEVAEFQVSHDPAEPFVIAGVLFDVEPPFDERRLEPGIAQRLVNIVLDVRPGTDPHGESQISLVNNIGRPPFNNVITVDSQSVAPRLGRAGTVYFEPLERPFPLFFIRGDFDGSGTINLSDPVAMLNFLFVGQSGPDCPDAADATDDGRLDISDASFILNFLFRGGSYPPPPHPFAGLDPTEDDFGDCLPGNG